VPQRSKTVKLTYLLSQAYLEQVFIETGTTPNRTVTIELDPALLTQTHRAYLVRLTGNAEIPEALSLREFTSYLHCDKPVRDNHRPVYFDAPVPASDALALFEADMARYEAAEAEIVRLRAKCDAEQREAEARNEAYEAQRKADAEAEAKAKAQREADKLGWVAAHGSSHLRAAVAAGYDCQRLYVTERAAVEYPGFVVDFDDRASWKARSCPSEAALAFALAHEGEVVWLTAPPREHDDYEPYEAREAVVVRGYLGKYDLVCEME